ncbi:ParM/StbA family protein [Clostridium perfringens]|uniref:ParM/StbA family protein n=1 Tax=Clostridium perfringens TaxID=1502 RepID=UPI001D8A7806|nr:ParM/StbA family protein [Clostridium perfringens]EHA6441867.1 ParM/StbA family protein [Clostridium perfringens]MDU1018238.1 ParM/StbA family protein [Clostridium perfringens]MEA5268980.1 ParM/StbA family protein [Clostridium perfringens]MEA5271564.1 ParM/StbA family protein [Clostridium perfringens]MEA5342140.1 ParM/StbA family protein [Clostridium perfringens]
MAQIIGLDIGRGYTKGYTEVNGLVKECMFKSIIGEGRSLNFSDYENPIMINFEGEDFFVGLLAEIESQTLIRNSKDSKTTSTVQKLIAAALSNLAVEEEVKIMLGVPYKSFRKSILEEVQSLYKDKEIKVKDKINGGTKEIKIVDISIFREGDAALYWQVRNNKSNSKPVGIVSVGFRTTEMSYFDKGLKFNDKKSDTLEFGNRSAMSNVRDKLLNKGIIKDINEIDTSKEYEDMKKSAYALASENIEQQIEDKWVNLSEMDIYIAGGTALNMNFDNKFKVIEDAQMATAKGLWLIGTRTFK